MARDISLREGGPDSDADDVSSDDRKIIDEGKKRFARCEAWEGPARKNFVQDLKFANADAYNMWQWPDDARNLRQADKKPCFTINKTRQHCLQVMNDARQNKSSVAVRAVGDGASYEAAQVFQGIVRHIEYISNAISAYQTATRFQVQGGIGYWRIVTRYAGDDTFDQEIYIERIKDPLSVYIDPDHSEADASDARFAFIFEDVAKDEFDAMYPDLKDQVGSSVLGDQDKMDSDHVRVAEYYRVTEKRDQLISVPGSEQPVRKSQLGPELSKVALETEGAKVRDVAFREVEWFKIAGDRIVDRTVWVGTTIPIVQVMGEVTVIDGRLDRKGHVRALIDPQRNLNYWTSEAATQVALQSKIPWLAAVAAIEEYEDYWAGANTENYAYLPFKHVDDQGNPIPPPARQQPPVMASAYIEGVKLALDGLQLVSGQYQAQMGAPSNEQSGVAIQQRQRQGDNATYHFIDHLASAIRRTGKILIEIIPKVYDTERVVKILAEDGSESEVRIDPAARQAYQQIEKAENDNIRAIFNPKVGKYDVEADVGPAFATRRQEAFNAFVQIATHSPEMMNLIGDLMFKAADFPMADQVAERLRRMVPAQATGDGPPPQVAQMQQQMQAMGKLLQTMSQKLQTRELELKDKTARIAEGAEQKIIDAYKAETDRLGVFKDFLTAEPEAALALVRQVIGDALNTSVVPSNGVAA